MPTLRSTEDPKLSATVVRRWALTYTDGADAALDRAAHVRSGSALVRIGQRIVIVQDDANVLAVLDLPTGRVDPITLPAGPDGRRQFDDTRGNKKDKLDLEAAIPLDDAGLLSLGSGSAPGRDRILRVDGVGTDNPEIVLHEAGPLYALLRAATEFSGSELNVEGAALRGTRILLLNRGNGAARDGLGPVNASAWIDGLSLLAWLHDPTVRTPPALADVRQWSLGEIGGVPLTFTDAATGPNGALLYLAAAEDTPNAAEDGPVSGVAVGLLEREGGRHALLRDAEGALVTDKAEGLLLDAEQPGRAWVVFDLDDPERPTELAELRLTGF